MCKRWMHRAVGAESGKGLEENATLEGLWGSLGGRLGAAYVFFRLSLSSI